MKPGFLKVVTNWGADVKIQDSYAGSTRFLDVSEKKATEGGNLSAEQGHSRRS